MQPAGMDQLTPKEREQVAARLDELQMHDSMNTFNGLVERCFNECITSFRAKDLSQAEQACVQNCVQKFMNFSQRVGQRFSEMNLQQQS